MNLVIKVFDCILLQSQSFVWVRAVVFKSKFVLYQIYHYLIVHLFEWLNKVLNFGGKVPVTNESTACIYKAGA